MITVKITNNSSTAYRMSRRHGLVRPAVGVGETKSFTFTLQAYEGDDKRGGVAQELQTILGDSDYDVLIIDQYNRKCFCQGDLAIDDELSLGSAALKFNRVEVTGDLTVGEAGNLITRELFVGGNVAHSAAATGDLIADTTRIAGNLTINGGLGVDNVFENGSIIGNVVIANSMGAIFRQILIVGNLTIGATAASALGHDLNVVGTITDSGTILSRPTLN